MLELLVPTSLRRNFFLEYSLQIMIVAKNISKIKQVVKKYKKKNQRIGFVPTMGALHQGHLSLVKRANTETDFLVVSIFVNPLQFGPREDFKQYPRNFKKDELLLSKAGVNLIFYPTPGTMYPQNFSTYVEEISLSKPLCGKSRPAHFRGVTTVVAKLFNIVEPDVAYFGYKDYQQAQIIKRMVRDLNFPIALKLCPIIRDSNGLALSSRNAYLSSNQRKDAKALSLSLKLAKELVKKGVRNSSLIKRKVRNLINSKRTTRIDYVEIVDPYTLKPLGKVNKPALLAVAVLVGGVRLIDNTLLYP